MKAAIEADSITALAEDEEGTLWVLTLHDTAVLRDGRLVPILTEPRWTRGGNAVLASRDGSVWIGGAGLTRLRGGKTESYESGKDIPMTPAALAEDARGRLWVGTTDGRVGTFLDGRFTDSGPGSPFPVPVQAIAFDEHGSLWIGALGGGIHRASNGRIEALTTADGLRSDDVFAIAFDPEGSVWFGTPGGGLHRLRRKAVATLSTREELTRTGSHRQRNARTARYAHCLPVDASVAWGLAAIRPALRIQKSIDVRRPMVTSPEPGFSVPTKATASSAGSYAADAGARLPGAQLKLCFPFGLSQAAERSRTPFTSFHTSRLSL